jgi:hypothetical protein
VDRGKVRKYLRQRAQGESNEAFRERAEDADYTNHLAAIVDSLVGLMTGVEENAARTWGPAIEGADGRTETGGLGDPKVPGSPAFRLWTNADGRGTSWLSLWAGLAVELSLMHTAWLLVDTTEGGAGVVRMLPPEAVVNWLEDAEGNIVEALIEEHADPRSSLRQKPGSAKRYVELTAEGVQRWRRDDTGNAVALGPLEAWGTPFVSAAGEPIVPLRRVTLPMRRHVGLYLARKVNALFNRKSRRDHVIASASFAKLMVDGDANVFQAVKEALAKGNNVLHGKHTFDAPPTGPAEVATTVLEADTKELYLTAFREYGDAAAQRTATEVKQNVAAGAGAYLALLSTTLDQAEAWALHLLEQIELGTGKAGVAAVTRSTDFLPADMEAVMTKLQERVFGPNVAVPLGRKAQTEAAKQLAAYMGLPVDDDEIEAAVTARELVAQLTAAIGFPVPGEARALALAKVFVASGLVDPEEEVELEDGQKTKLLDLILAKARQLAEAEDVAKRREAETFGIPRPIGRTLPPAEDDDEADEA